MKTLGLKRTVLLLIMIIGGMRVSAQQLDTEVPGDNFSLEGALELFKKSSSPEDFEKKLNSADSKVNNLDLNGDGYIDYIRVIDRNEGNVHAFILQALISDTESQDVAVIELEKLANGEAVLQITGDADIYGVETIIEPTEEVRVYAGTTTSRNIVNVWTWPAVQYIYSPYYTSVWISPWHWSYRPYWYRPWRPVAYYVYRPWWRPYRVHYTVCYTHRVSYARHIYRPYRTTSVIVHNRHHDRIIAYRSTRHDYDRNGHYRHDNNGKRDHRGESVTSRSGRSGDQNGRRSTAYTNTGRQSNSRDRSYTRNETPSRSSQPVVRDNTRGNDRNTAIRRSEPSRMQSPTTYQNRSTTPQTRTSRSSSETRSSTVERTNQRSQGQVSRPAPQVSRRAPQVSRPAPAVERRTVERSNPPSRSAERSSTPQRSGSQNNSGNRRGGN